MGILAVLVILASVVPAAVPTYAATSTTGSGGFFAGFIHFIAQKFGLDENQVKSAANDYKSQVKQNVAAKFQTREENRLNALVKAGKITDAQKKAILTELFTLQTKYNKSNFANLTPAQRKQKFQDEKNEIDVWAKSQNIDPKYVLPGFGMFPHMGMRRFNRWGINFATPTP